MITDADLHKAIANIARTPDGMQLYRFLQREVMAVSASTDSCALLQNSGERRFASKLMHLMNDAIAEQAVDAAESSIDTASGSAADRPVVLARPRAIGSPRVTARQYLARTIDGRTDRAD